jgi:hypothetical protein
MLYLTFHAVNAVKCAFCFGMAVARFVTTTKGAFYDL